LIGEAALLEGDVGEVFLVGEIDFGDEGAFALDGIFDVGDERGDLGAAGGIDAGFERGDLTETPFGVGNGLDEVAFVVIGGGVLGEEAVEVFLVDGGVFGG
jgi:hypothetical protein